MSWSMGTIRGSGTTHDILVVVISSTELESQFLEALMCISSCFNNKEQQTQFQCLINTYFSPHRGSGCGLDWVCSTFLLISGSSQKEQPSFGTCGACGKEQKFQWPSQIRQLHLKLLLRQAISHFIGQSKSYD